MHKGTIPSIVVESGATLNCGTTMDPILFTGQWETKAFHTPFGQTAQSTQTAKLHNEAQEPARTVHMLPGLQNSLLLSISKFAGMNCITIFTPQEIKFLMFRSQSSQALESQSSQGP